MNTIIIGLGNPGENFLHTRHNIGFRIVKYLQKNYPFKELSEQKKYLTSVGGNGKNKIVLALPLTFVNKSGEAVKEIIKNYPVNKKLKNSSQKSFLPVIAVHDDSDLPVGKVKISIGKSSGGHKGVESIIKSLKSKDFIRFRIGIQPIKGKRKKAEQIVLGSFSAEEEKIINKIIKKTAPIIMATAQENVDKGYAMLSSL